MGISPRPIGWTSTPASERVRGVVEAIPRD
jgi:hypothetical protein